MNPPSKTAELRTGDIGPGVDAPGLRVVRGRRPVSLPAHGGYDEEHRRGGQSGTVTSAMNLKDQVLLVNRCI